MKLIKYIVGERVIAFEPVLDSFERLRASCHFNHWCNGTYGNTLKLTFTISTLIAIHLHLPPNYSNSIFIL